MSSVLKQDFKKHFFRVKQKADQGLGRLGKSEVLTEELQELEKHIGLIKTHGHNTSKKIQSCYPGLAVSDAEKRKKKTIEYALYSQFVEAGDQLNDTLFGHMYKTAADLEMELASQSTDMQKELEEKVILPIAQLVDVEIPNIMKIRKHLKQLVLDMDSAKNRFMTTQNDISKGKIPQSKLEPVQQDFEDSQTRVDQEKDHLSMEMCTFQAKEGQHCEFLINFIEIQAEYYRKAYELLQQQLPHMKEVCERERVHPIFGVPLEDHLRLQDREISFVIEQCIALLAQYGLEEEGLFRIAGSASKVKKIKTSFDASIPLDFDEIGDIHCIAGVLKQYLRELPEPLMTHHLYDDWIKAMQCPHDEKMTTLWKLCDSLPKPYYDNLRYLIKFLAKLAEKCDINKMNTSNIAIVMGPNLLWSEQNSNSMMSTGVQSSVVDALVAHAEYFFPGEVEFGWPSDRGTPTGTLRRAPAIPNHSSSVVPSSADLDNQPSSPLELTDSSSLAASSPKLPAKRVNRKAPAPPPPPTVPDRQASLPQVVVIETKQAPAVKPPAPEEKVSKRTSDKKLSTESFKREKSPAPPTVPPNRRESGEKTGTLDRNMRQLSEKGDRPQVPPPAPPKPSEHHTGPARPPPASPGKAPDRPRLPSERVVPDRPERPTHKREASSGGDKMASSESEVQNHQRTGSDGTSAVKYPAKPPRPQLPPPPTKPPSREGSLRSVSGGAGEMSKSTDSTLSTASEKSKSEVCASPRENKKPPEVLPKEEALKQISNKGNVTASEAVTAPPSELPMQPNPVAEDYASTNSSSTPEVPGQFELAESCSDQLAVSTASDVDSSKVPECPLSPPVGSRLL